MSSFVFLDSARGAAQLLLLLLLLLMMMIHLIFPV